MAKRHLQAGSSQSHLYGKGYIFPDGELSIDGEGRVHDFTDDHARFLLKTGKWKLIDPEAEARRKERRKER